MVFPDGEWASSDAKWSTSSFPNMPVWLGIQFSVAIVPEELVSGMKKAHGVVVEFSDNEPSM